MIIKTIAFALSVVGGCAFLMHSLLLLDDDHTEEELSIRYDVM